MQQLRKLAADPRADETAIREQLKALRDLEEQTAVAVRRDYDALDEVLDARQQVRFRLLRGAAGAAEARPPDAGPRARLAGPQAPERRRADRLAGRLGPAVRVRFTPSVLACVPRRIDACCPGKPRRTPAPSR